jgi:hypothetical protein
VTVLLAIAGFWLGALVGVLVARWRFSCRKIGHVWERYEIEGAHYRDPATEAFRVCKRCKHMELIDLCRPDGDLPGIEPTWVPPTPSPNARPKPRPTHLPSDGMRVSKLTVADVVAYVEAKNRRLYGPLSAEPLPRPGPGRKIDA